MAASQPESLNADLAFVAAAVKRSRRRALPVGIAAAWALYVAIGYAWTDYNPRTCGWFFLLAWPAALAASGYFGRRGPCVGRCGSREAWRVCIHFMSILLAGGAIAGLAFTQGIDGMLIGQLIAMACGLVYFLAGVHYNARFYGLGVLLMAGAVLVKYATGYGWTILGLLTAAAWLSRL